MFYYFAFFVFLVGLAVGSFLNCLICRLHTGESMFGRSYCPKCKKQIAWYDNMPILSFVLLGGKCRVCKQTISWQYPAVELITGILFVMIFFINIQYSIFNIQDSQLIIKILRDWLLISVMIIIFVYDLRWYLILDIVTLPAALVMLILNLFLGFSWQNLLVSGIIGSSFFLIQFVVSRGRWIGGGDIRLGLLMGLSLGWPQVLVALFLAYFIGSAVSIGLMLAGKKKWSSKLPLGTFLAVAAIIVLFWGEAILRWYL